MEDVDIYTPMDIFTDIYRSAGFDAYLELKRKILTYICSDTYMPIDIDAYTEIKRKMLTHTLMHTAEDVEVRDADTHRIILLR